VRNAVAQRLGRLGHHIMPTKAIERFPMRGEGTKRTRRPCNGLTASFNFPILIATMATRTKFLAGKQAISPLRVRQLPANSNSEVAEGVLSVM
jgi:hypothetical protein